MATTEQRLGSFVFFCAVFVYFINTTAADNGLLAQLYKRASEKNRPLVLVIDNGQGKVDDRERSAEVQTYKRHTSLPYTYHHQASHEVSNTNRHRQLKQRNEKGFPYRANSNYNDRKKRNHEVDRLYQSIQKLFRYERNGRLRSKGKSPRHDYQTRLRSRDQDVPSVRPRDREDREEQERRDREDRDRRDRDRPDRRDREEQDRREREEKDRRDREDRDRRERDRPDRRDKEVQDRREREDQDRRDREDKDRRERERLDRRDREEQDRRDREDRDRRDREEQDRRDRVDRDRPDRRDREDQDRREREDRDRRDREEQDRRDRENRDRGDRPDKDRQDRVDVKDSASAQIPVVKKLLRSLNCAAKDECEDSCNNYYNGQNQNECATTCEEKFSCDEEEEEYEDPCEECKSGGCGEPQCGGSTKGEVLVTEEPGCKRC